jgi:hypothetical protein
MTAVHDTVGRKLYIGRADSFVVVFVAYLSKYRLII